MWFGTNLVSNCILCPVQYIGHLYEKKFICVTSLLPDSILIPPYASILSKHCISRNIKGKKSGFS